MAKKDSPIDTDIEMTHERFIEAMGMRVPLMPLEQKERYFAVLSILVGKLEDPSKHLRDILSEMMIEAASLIMEEMNTR